MVTPSWNDQLRCGWRSLPATLDFGVWFHVSSLLLVGCGAPKPLHEAVSPQRWSQMHWATRRIFGFWVVCFCVAQNRPQRVEMFSIHQDSLFHHQRTRVSSLHVGHQQQHKWLHEGSWCFRLEDDVHPPRSRFRQIHEESFCSPRLHKNLLLDIEFLFPGLRTCSSLQTSSPDTVPCFEMFSLAFWRFLDLD